MLTSEEEAIITIIRLNKATPRTEIIKRWQIGRLKIRYHWRSRKNAWGRFGGGWQWKLGFQAAGNTLILELLIFSLRFDLESKI